jgi:N-acyl-phosphatidylethanolamine-hydrolysing phospholipase D
MDWWESKRLVVSFDGIADILNPTEPIKIDSRNKRIVDITCTPSQHFTGRSLWDHFKTLWASWVVEEIVIDQPADATPPCRSPVKVYFAGDTAYRTVLKGEDEDKVPVCPAFEEIGNKFGGFDFAMIPIG